MIKSRFSGNPVRRKTVLQNEQEADVLIYENEKKNDMPDSRRAWVPGCTNWEVKAQERAEIITAPTVLAKYGQPIAEAIRLGVGNRAAQGAKKC